MRKKDRYSIEQSCWGLLLIDDMLQLSAAAALIKLVKALPALPLIDAIGRRLARLSKLFIQSDCLLRPLLNHHHPRPHLAPPVVQQHSATVRR